MSKENRYYKPNEKLPTPKKWMKCIINGKEEDGTIYGVTEWVYCVDVKDGIISLSETEECEYIFTWEEEQYTHWTQRNNN